MTKGLTSIRNNTPSKKEKYKNEKIKRKLYTDNMNWNDWKYQLNWNRLEWVNPRSKTARKKTYSTSSKSLSLSPVTVTR